jgi:hypothetical protein
MTSRSRFLSVARIAAGSLLLAAAVHCSSGSSQHPPTQTTSVVGASGGTAASSDGTMTLSVPSGALASNVALTVSPATTSVPGIVGAAWVVGPAGTTFTKPVTLTLSYAAAGGGSAFRIATYANGALHDLPGYSLDASAQTVSGTTTTVGTFGLVAAASSTTSTADAGTVCFTMSGGASCEGGSSSSGSSGAGGGSTSGSGGTCTVSTCAGDNATICAQYPGSSLSSCVDGQNGYAASCCYPAGQPVCIVDSPGVACGGSSGSSSGCGTGSSTSSGGFTCDTPTCAASSPCSGYAGTTVKSCTDSTTGYSATCCYPVGTVPPSNPVASGGSSSGSSSGGVGFGGSSGGSSGSSSGGDPGPVGSSTGSSSGG